MSKFSHVHCHTQFSLLDGAASIQSLYKKAVNDNMPAIAITDHGNMFGAFEFVAEAYKHKNEDGTLKVKPIVGCEFYVVKDRHIKTFTKELKDERFHQVLLAKNKVGYQNLIKLTSLGYIEGMYSKYPRIDKELIHKYHEGLIATTCCLAGIDCCPCRETGPTDSRGRDGCNAAAPGHRTPATLVAPDGYCRAWRERHHATVRTVRRRAKGAATAETQHAHVE